MWIGRYLNVFWSPKCSLYTIRLWCWKQKDDSVSCRVLLEWARYSNKIMFSGKEPEIWSQIYVSHAETRLLTDGPAFHNGWFRWQLFLLRAVGPWLRRLFFFPHQGMLSLLHKIHHLWLVDTRFTWLCCFDSLVVATCIVLMALRERKRAIHRGGIEICEEYNSCL